VLVLLRRWGLPWVGGSQLAEIVSPPSMRCGSMHTAGFVVAGVRG